MTVILTEEEAAKVLALSLEGLRKLRRQGRAPAHFLIGRNIRYTEQAIEEFIRVCHENSSKRETVKA